MNATAGIVGCSSEPELGLEPQERVLRAGAEQLLLSLGRGHRQPDLGEVGVQPADIRPARVETEGAR